MYKKKKFSSKQLISSLYKEATQIILHHKSQMMLWSAQAREVGRELACRNLTLPQPVGAAEFLGKQ